MGFCGGEGRQGGGWGGLSSALYWMGFCGGEARQGVRRGGRGLLSDGVLLRGRAGRVGGAFLSAALDGLMF